MVIKILRIIGNLKFAITLLITIAIIIALGSIIEQDKPTEFYQQIYSDTTPLFGFLTWKFIQFIGIDHLYRTFWFICILLLFATSLLTCTFLQQFPVLKFSRRCNFLQSKFFNIETFIKPERLGKFLNKLLFEGYFVYQQKTNFYASKGLIGRVAPIFVHLSIIVILFGSIIGAICGFSVEELIPKSEIFHSQNTVFSGPLSNFSQQPIRINDFWINYYKDNKIKQFYSNISILDEFGNELITKTISVNKPLIYKNFTFYQTDWTFIGLRIENENKYFQIPTRLSENFTNKLWLTWLPINNNIKKIQETKLAGKTLLINNYKEIIFSFNLKGKLEKDIDLYEFLVEKNYKICDLIVSTGLQIKSDPGAYFIYIGFGGLILSTFLSYISFSQIWGATNILKIKKEFVIFSKTNRDKSSLNLELLKLIQNFN